MEEGLLSAKQQLGVWVSRAGRAGCGQKEEEGRGRGSAENIRVALSPGLGWHRPPKLHGSSPCHLSSVSWSSPVTRRLLLGPLGPQVLSSLECSAQNHTMSSFFQPTLPSIHSAPHPPCSVTCWEVIQLGADLISDCSLHRPSSLSASRRRLAHSRP